MGGRPSTIGHEACTRAEIARRLARLLGCDYGGEHDPTARYDASAYFVPSDTLTSAVATSLGIRSAEDLFGGVVPAAFVATKTITHPLRRARRDRAGGLVGGISSPCRELRSRRLQRFLERRMR